MYVGIQPSNLKVMVWWWELREGGKSLTTTLNVHSHLRTWIVADPA